MVKARSDYATWLTNGKITLDQSRDIHRRLTLYLCDQQLAVERLDHLDNPTEETTALREAIESCRESVFSYVRSERQLPTLWLDRLTPKGRLKD